MPRDGIFISDSLSSAVAWGAYGTWRTRTVASRVTRGPGRAQLVLLLDWGVRDTTEANHLNPDDLAAWLAFCSQKLAEQ